MKIWKSLMICACVIALFCVAALTASAGPQALKENICDTCHKDYGAIFPKAHPDMGKGMACLSCHAPDPNRKEASKFSDAVHKAHQGGKTKLECSACHVQ